MSSDRLKKLRALKARKSLPDEEEEQDEYKIYDELSTEEFRKVTRDRLLEDDFVVDDSGEGYIETGADDWEDGTHSYYSDEEVDQFQSKKKQKTKKNEKAAKNDGNITKLFRTAPKPKPRPALKKEDSQAIDDLISGLGDSAPIKSEEKKRKVSAPRRDPSPKPYKREVSPEPIKREDITKGATTAKSPRSSPPPGSTNESKDVEMAMSPEPVSSPAADAAHRLENGSDQDNDDDDDDGLAVKPLSGSVAKTQVAMSGVRTKPKPKAVKQKLPKEEDKDESSPPQSSMIKEDTTSWLSVGANIANEGTTSEQQSVPANFEDISEEDGSFKMFWTDYEERNNQLFLYGKVKSTKGEKTYPSCMVRLTDLFRTLYVLVGKDEEGEEHEIEDVYNELQDVLKRHRVEQSYIKPELKKYCFEETDVPRGESTYLKLLLPATAAIDWDNVKSKKFTKVFGARKSLFEEFVLSKKVMGPCWLNFKNPTELQNASWCRITASVSLSKGFEMTDTVEIIHENDAPPIPPLTVMSLSIRTLKNDKTNKQEVFAISGRVYHNIEHDTTQPANEIKSVLFTEVRPIDQLFPSGFEKQLEKEQPRHTTTHKNEGSLLRKFVAMMQKYDPDVIVGHELLNIHLSVIAHRLKTNDIKFWDKMGRRRQAKFPHGFGASAYEYNHLREITSGRLLCDLTNDMGQSMTSKCSSWSLTEMCNIYLDETRVDVDINASKSQWNRDSEGLIRYLAHNEVDAYYIAAMAFRIQILALSKVLTNLAGNSWARTLAGSRVDRNEFILLHEFTNQGYIVPDKGSSMKRGNNKDKFQGGMVLEPEKGLHKEIVLVMDFNSLYPSIIQEYNICFTTVERANCKSTEDPPPNPPSKDVPMGIFPQLVQNLVKRRREVKKLMKSNGASSTEKAQWDIKQQALKLTANSMYGCLGYQGSRFYALPLAMLTTFRGREALKSTQELAEDNSLHVVYGDTDSVMINTNTTTYNAAIKVGEDFKKLVNQQYRHLEIDIDNVFQCILLQAKKKYAALQMIERSNGEIDTTMEIKGLDLKRREFCQLSKDASSKILEQILTKEDFDVAQEEIFEYTEKLAEDIREHKIPENKFIIRTMLGKDPGSYNNTDSMPAVRLAQRRKANGEIIKAGDVMQFIIVEGTGAVGDRARTMAEVKKQQLKPDAEYYLSHQILPPLERLFGNIEGAQLPQLAESLGLDTRKYNRPGHSDGFVTQDRDIQPLESTIPDKERFAKATRLSIKCSSCNERFDYGGVDLATTAANGIRCPECSTTVVMTRVNAQLEMTIRNQISRYYAGWLVCDDPSCGVRTRQVNVYGKKCSQQDGDCRGVMRYEYSDRDLYNQLLYFDSLFDIDRMKSNIESEMAAGTKGQDVIQLKALAEQNRQRFAVPRQVVSKYLSNCGRRYVDMHNIFSFM